MKAFIITSMIRSHKFTYVLSATTNRAKPSFRLHNENTKFVFSTFSQNLLLLILVPRASILLVSIVYRVSPTLTKRIEALGTRMPMAFLTANQRGRSEYTWKTTLRKRKLDDCISVDRCVSELSLLILTSIRLLIFLCLWQSFFFFAE